MQKSNLLLIAVAFMSSLIVISGACVNVSGGWTMCQGLLPGPVNGTGFTPLVNSILDNFPTTNINQTTGLPIQSNEGYFLILVGIGISEAIFIELGAHIGGGARNEFNILNYVTIIYLITTLVFRMYGLVGGTAVDIAISLVGISIIVSIFFGGNG